MELLTQIQKEKFLSVSGTEFTFSSLTGQFETPFPNNNREWQYSPWLFTYVIEEESGNLICELDHRMTSNKICGWDRNGNELDNDILFKYFTPHI